MSLLDGLARRLHDRGLGVYDPTNSQVLADDWAIALEALPTAPDKAIALYQYAGAESHGGQPWDEPTVAIRVRGTEDSTVSRAKAQAIYSALHGMSYVELDDPDRTYVTDCLATTAGPVLVGPDANSRHVHSVTFRVSIDNPTEFRPQP